MILATGMAVPNVPYFEGVEYTEGYEDISTNEEDYEGQTVLILGKLHLVLCKMNTIYLVSST